MHRKYLAPNTVLLKSDNVLHIKYYDTIILSFFEDGRIILYAGHYQTAGTKLRINKFQDSVRVEQKNHKWWIVHKNGKRERFYDGFTIYNDKYNELIKRMIDA